eukprot:3076009-Pyramimonas_sp.AAC.1
MRAAALAREGPREPGRAPRGLRAARGRQKHGKHERNGEKGGAGDRRRAEEGPTCTRTHAARNPFNT